jgi:hypothetical protein
MVISPEKIVILRAGFTGLEREVAIVDNPMRDA